MRMQLTGRAGVAVAVGVAVVTGVGGVGGSRVARADGTLDLRNVYYKEKSTRVVQPMIDAIFEVGEHGVLVGHALVDSITSASSASGAANSAPFTKAREEGGVGYTQTLDSLQLGGDTKYSTEDDYTSFFVGGHAKLDVADKNTTFGVGGGASFDTLSSAPQGLGTLTLACNPANLNDQQMSCPQHIYSGYATVSQILGPDAILSGSYDVATLRGFQSNPYRLVVTNDGEVSERDPDRRFRESFAATLRYYVAASETTLIGSYRYYYDDWHIHAQTPEARIVQQIGDSADAGFRFRYYTQTAAFFYEPRYNTSDPTIQPFLTADPKLSAFTGELMEAKLGIYGREFHLHGMWSDARFEGSLAYIIQHNEYGNAVEAQLALSLPFSY
jgi:hypothetical protein